MRLLRLFTSTTALITAFLGLAGCGCYGVLCEPCTSPGIYVHVIDAATQEPIDDATVTTGSKTCSLGISGPGTYLCDVPVGDYTIDISAPGHAPQTIKVTLPEDESDSCCSCGPFKNAQVELAAL